MKDYVLTLLVAAAATYILTPLVRRLAVRIGAMKQPRERDVHVVPVATLGGLAMYGGLVAGLLVSEQIPQLREQAFTNTGILNGLLLAGGLLVVIGFIDDRWGMGALTKGAGQVAAGGILVATGTTLSWLPLPGGITYIPDTDQRALLTILIVVATINAVNFIDGLDGLAAGIVCIAAVSFFIYYYSLTKVIHMSALAAPALASAILIGMCIGFLPHNFSPAKIFMGDTGSMLLGLLLAYAPISSINSLPEANLTSQANRYPVILPLLLPAALLIIPYADLLLAVVRRTRAGQSPFAPDRKHLHHRLLDIGHSQRTSVLIMYLWAAVFSGSVVWLSVEKTVQPRNAGHHGAADLRLRTDHRCGGSRPAAHVHAQVALVAANEGGGRGRRRSHGAGTGGGARTGCGRRAVAAARRCGRAQARRRLSRRGAASPELPGAATRHAVARRGDAARGLSHRAGARRSATRRSARADPVWAEPTRQATTRAEPGNGIPSEVPLAESAWWRPEPALE